MRYLHTMVRVTNLEVSLDFYCAILGFTETRRYENETERFTLVFLAAPGDIEGAEETSVSVLELTYNWPSADSVPEAYTAGRNFGHLAYEVDNIYELCHKLVAAGIIINRPPRDGRMAFIKSPDGISIELLQAGTALPQQEPWTNQENIGVW